MIYCNVHDFLWPRTRRMRVKAAEKLLLRSYYRQYDIYIHITVNYTERARPNIRNTYDKLLLLSIINFFILPEFSHPHTSFNRSSFNNQRQLTTAVTVIVARANINLSPAIQSILL